MTARKPAAKRPNVHELAVLLRTAGLFVKADAALDIDAGTPGGSR